jgi:hypothetical protein
MLLQSVLAQAGGSVTLTAPIVLDLNFQAELSDINGTFDYQVPEGAQSLG